jgi:hypothetical protein
MHVVIIMSIDSVTYFLLLFWRMSLIMLIYNANDPDSDLNERLIILVLAGRNGRFEVITDFGDLCLLECDPV